jgi:hypothetical protein
LTTTGDDRNESGIILAQTALFLIPMLLFAAFATDVGSWYVEAQKLQRTADAAALAGVAQLPDLAAAEQAARDAAARNGIVDATPGDNSDFDTGPLPQVRVTSYGSKGMEVEIRSEATAYLGRLVLDSIEIQRFGAAEFVKSVHLGNPTSGIGTGDIPSGSLGVPSDLMWLSINAYCSDHEQGDPFAAGYYDGPAAYNGQQTCGPTAGSVFPEASPNPTFDDDAYVFVVEYQPGSPTLDLGIYEPGIGCSGSGSTSDWFSGPILNIEVYGPSDTFDHRGFLAANSPIATPSFDETACISNSPSGDGWWPLLTGASTPNPAGGFYYIRVSGRHPGQPGPFTSDVFWEEAGNNNFSIRALRSGDTLLCTLSTADPTCPQVYGLDWLPVYRQIPNSESAFYLAEVAETHAGGQMEITFFDAAEGIDNLQFVDSNGTAMPFRWRYADTSIGLVSGSGFLETAFVNHSDTCTWGGAGGNPCLDTSNRDDWNDHFVVIEIDIPQTYTCGADCWWRIRYVTAGNPTDRSAWTISLQGDPVRLVE